MCEPLADAVFAYFRIATVRDSVARTRVNAYRPIAEPQPDGTRSALRHLI